MATLPTDHYHAKDAAKGHPWLVSDRPTILGGCYMVIFIVSMVFVLVKYVGLYKLCAGSNHHIISAPINSTHSSWYDMLYYYAYGGCCIP